ncbi:MAG TPA: ABC transporter permease, partial [Gemmatimonadaceae bacterium]|nr:ABC transporter permease [Gemmatimonadaceae bacterium]
MTWLDRLLQRRRIHDDLAEEIRAHIDEKTEALVRSGMPPADARHAARRAFGNVTNIQERGRDVWQWPTAESVLMDVRYAVRQMRRTPALSAIIIATLAIGIAATATVFSWTRSVLLDPLPGAGDPTHVLALETTSASGSWTPTSWLDYRDLRTYLKSFDGLAAAYPTSLTVGDDAHAERGWGELVSTNFFTVLRVRPALGSFFPNTSDEAAGGTPSIVISYDLWQRRWHGDSTVVGRVVDVNRFPFAIAGVAPRDFHGSMPGEQFDVWVPASMLGQIVPTGGWWLRDRGTRTFRVLARLRDGIGFAAARDEVERFTAFMAKVNGGASEGMGGRLMPLWQSHWGVQDGLRAPLIVLLGACGLVLLIVCANSANLLLARAISREREFGLRIALGAPRTRLLRQLLTEAALLAGAGSALGLVGAGWLAHSLRALVPSFAAPSLVAPHVDGSVLAFTAALAVAVTIFAGIAPALHGSREAFAESLGSSSRGAVGGVRSTRTRRALVIAEMALAVVSLVGAGLFAESFRRARGVAPGFDADRVAMASVSITLAGYDSAHGEAFLSNVADRIRREPGIQAVAYSDYVPLSVGSGSWEDLRVEGYAPPANENMKLARAAIGPGYFETLRIPLLAGRDFTVDDDSAHTAVMVVNEAFVRHFLSGRTAL